ncbi:MAG: hypothetical protein ACRDNW_12800 [Trebonia sp.]
MLNDGNRDDAWIAGETTAAMREFARTVTEVPPLRLAAESAPAQPDPRLNGGRRWRTWLAPVAAAATVAAVAVALVVVRDRPGGGTAPASQGAVPGAVPVISQGEAPTAGGTGPGGIPRYYVSIGSKIVRGDRVITTPLVVGDSLTGKEVAGIPSVRNVRFLDVTAAGDDQTFVAAGMVGTGTASPTIAFYEISLASGKVTMTPMAIPPLPAVDGKTSLLKSDGVPVALNESGTELAVADFRAGTGDMAVQVFSVTSGALLDEWTTTDSSLSLHGMSETPTLTWVDNDQGLDLATLGAATKSDPGKRVKVGKTVAWQSVRQINVGSSPSGSGDLEADSTLVRHAVVGGEHGTEGSCGYMPQWPPAIGADGKTFICTSGQSFFTYPLAPGLTGTGHGTLDLTTKPNEFVSTVLWASPSGGTIIAEWGVDDNGTIQPGGGSDGKYVQVNAISNGKATPLRFPPGVGAVEEIAF